ncbi:MAG TPA: hypothetical protein VL974_06880 [Magnetospirillum sp.]|jgi:hypothetical protein|nr:hypothetical protein [Magnetospirillum sp.]
MRFVWTFIIGLLFAGFVMLATAPLMLAGIGAAAWALKGSMFSALSGESVFGVREKDGRLDGRMVNVTFQTQHVPMPGEPRPRRMLLRLEVTNADVFAARPGEGRVRLDAWALDSVADVKAPALYTIVAPGRAATLSEDGTLVVDHGGRRSVYSLSAGQWLYDADSLPASYAVEGERRRFVALAAAEEDMPARAVAVLTLATAQAPLKRLMIVADDPSRARLLRSGMSMIRPIPRLEDASRRTVDLSLPAGLVRVPVSGDDLDVAKAQLPQGLGVVELKPWGQKR